LDEVLNFLEKLFSISRKVAFLYKILEIVADELDVSIHIKDHDVFRKTVEDEVVDLHPPILLDIGQDHFPFDFIFTINDDNDISKLECCRKKVLEDSFCSRMDHSHNSNAKRNDF